jgi:hypothetical protein
MAFVPSAAEQYPKVSSGPLVFSDLDILEDRA